MTAWDSDTLGIGDPLIFRAINLALIHVFNSVKLDGENSGWTRQKSEGGGSLSS